LFASWAGVARAEVRTFPGNHAASLGEDQYLTAIQDQPDHPSRAVT
jgi:hypothetical protein